MPASVQSEDLTYLVNAIHMTSMRLSNHPALWNAPGIARAPVPTIKLKTNTIPTCNIKITTCQHYYRQKQSLHRFHYIRGTG